MTQGEKVGRGDALEDFLSFGRPKEGSDRYKAAWDRLREEVAELRAKVASMEDDEKQLRADLCVAQMDAEGLPSQAALDQVIAERDEALGLLRAFRPFIAVEDNPIAYDVRDRIDALLRKSP